MIFCGAGYIQKNFDFENGSRAQEAGGGAPSAWEQSMHQACALG